MKVVLTEVCEVILLWRLFYDVCDSIEDWNIDEETLLTTATIFNREKWLFVVLIVRRRVTLLLLKADTIVFVLLEEWYSDDILLLLLWSESSRRVLIEVVWWLTSIEEAVIDMMTDAMCYDILLTGMAGIIIDDDICYSIIMKAIEGWSLILLLLSIDVLVREVLLVMKKKLFCGMKAILLLVLAGYYWLILQWYINAEEKPG